MISFGPVPSRRLGSSLGITAHPIREDTMTELLRKDHADPITLDLLLHGNYIKQVRYNNRNFYIRNFINQ